MRATDVLTRDEIRTLLEKSDLQGLRAVGTTWALIAGSFALVAWWPALPTVALALVVLGGQQLALAVLMHEASHRTLMKTPWLNELVGQWVCGRPVWQDLHRYRVHHMDHHRYTASERDPDLSLVSPFPVSRGALVRKLLRDLSGVTGLKRIVGLVLMDLGHLDYTVAGNADWADQTHRTGWDRVRDGSCNLGPVLLTNLVLLGVLAAVGHAWLYLLWVGAWLTTFSVFVRLRSIAEHACTERSDDPFRNTRTTYANPLARLTVAPHQVQYHLEHHLLMTVPFHQLARMHQMLEERGALEQAVTAPGYADVLRQATGS